MGDSAREANCPTAADFARGTIAEDAAITYAPYWWDAAPRPKPAPPNLPSRVDVAIVGSGYTGLSAALTLARRGTNVVVLERDVPGFGASTRNGGQIGSGNQKFKVKKLIELRGREKAIAMLREGTQMLEFIAALIDREKIGCHFTRCGRFRGAIRPEHYDAMARDMDDLREVAGVESFMVPRKDQRAEIGSDLFYGGSVLPNDGALHPGLFHAGLMQRVLHAGGHIIGHAGVTQIAKSGPTFRLTTLAGELTANQVIIATDGYTGTLKAELNRRIVSVGSNMIATGVIPEQLYAPLMPKNRVYGNTNRVIYYFRGAPGERRIVWGGRVGRFARANTAAAYAHLAGEILEVFPALKDVPITHAWDGLIGYSNDEVPHIGQTSDGAWYVLGFSGTGVSRSVYFGNKVALKALGDGNGASAFDDLVFEPIPMRALTKRLIPVLEFWYRVRDRYNF